MTHDPFPISDSSSSALQPLVSDRTLLPSHPAELQVTTHVRYSQNHFTLFNVNSHSGQDSHSTMGRAVDNKLIEGEEFYSIPAEISHSETFSSPLRSLTSNSDDLYNPITPAGMTPICDFFTTPHRNSKK